MRILVTGAAGRLGQIFVHGLQAAGHAVVGLDRRAWPDAPVPFHRIDILRHAAEQIFRDERPEVCVHCAYVSQLEDERGDRHRVNLVGTKAVFDHCRRHGVAQTVFIGRHTYYGASSDAPLYHGEDDPPLGLETFPELADLVAADLFSGSMLWRAPEMTTTVLRFVYLLGPSRTGTLADFLKGPRVPMILGFDPLFQFMHETDAARALVAALEARLRGVFNVAGAGPLPLSALIHEAGRRRVVLPEPVLRASLGRFGLPALAPSAVDHIKYSLVVDGQPFREATGFVPKYGQLETVHAFRGG
jgi:UDP-glucose 4-epimerase